MSPTDHRVAETLAPFHRPGSRLEALRRLKRREFLRIGWRDYTSRWELPEVVGAISELADGLVRGALQVVQDDLAERRSAVEAHFAVIAMGKLGGRELNYSSDVDLLFVCDAVESGEIPQERQMRYATRVAEGLVAALGTATPEGHLFRVDMRLRPEGRYGPLVRTLASYREYYDRWIETWERQALLKARFIAGDAELGSRFIAVVEPRVYRQVFSTTILEDVRDVKQAIERRVSGAGQSGTNVKEGRGTIRDVEFTVQVLQLLFGGQRPELRTGSTLEALDCLAAAGLLTAEERSTLREHYVYFRTVEHRLQLMNDLPIRLVPARGRERDRLARLMGFPPASGAVFGEDYRRRADAVHAITSEILQRLGGDGSARGGALRPLIVGIREEEPRAALRTELEQRGFTDPKRSVEALESLATGGSRYSLPVSTQRLFGDLAERLIPAAAETPDPDAALAGLEALAHRLGAHRSFYQLLAEAPEMLDALCRVTGTSPLATEALLRHPEWRDMLFDADYLSQPHSVDDLLSEGRTRLDAARTPAQRRSALRRFQQRERLRILARDLLLNAGVEQTVTDLADLAEACLRFALADCAPTTDHRPPTTDHHLNTPTPNTQHPTPNTPPEAAGFAVIALGRLGGRELHYASDLDLFYLFDPERHPGRPSHRAFEDLAAEFTRSLREITEEGSLYEVDLRLRPEGKQGFVAAHIDAFRQYYTTRAQTWEKQSLIKARCVAGDADLAAEFLDWVTPLVYAEVPSPEREDEVRAMKRRIETERVDAAARPRHLKLGPGGLSDVEFLVQLLQMRHGGRQRELRQPNTLAALDVLARAGHLTPAEHSTLRDGYRFLTRLRQRLTLTSVDVAPETLPTDPLPLRRLARAMDFPDGDALLACHGETTAAIREVFRERFLGY